VACALALAACGSAAAVSTTTTAPRHTSGFSPPRTTLTQQAAYLQDVAKVDGTLATYAQSNGNLGLSALLNDGLAFCGYLRSGAGIDNAMTAVVAGASSVEPQTHLPSTVETFNTIDAVALLTLCPSEQAQIPPSARDTVHQLGQAIGAPAG